MKKNLLYILFSIIILILIIIFTYKNNNPENKIILPKKYSVRTKQILKSNLSNDFYFSKLIRYLYVFKNSFTFFSIRELISDISAFTNFSPKICSYNSIYLSDTDWIYSSDISGISCPTLP